MRVPIQVICHLLGAPGSEFDPSRANSRDHLAFSAGIHYCPGAGLARIEAVAALRALVEKHPDLRVAGGVKRRGSRNIHGVLRLPVRGQPVGAGRPRPPA